MIFAGGKILAQVILDVTKIEKIISTALNEDMPQGDITSENAISPDSSSQAKLLAKETGILAGIDIAEQVFKKIDVDIVFAKKYSDGDAINPKDILAEIKGRSVALLKAERTALNFLQRLSGIATLTHSFVQALAGSRTRLLDTRKTTPGLRILEKYAVKTGGGNNHRFSLSDMVMLKDNHLQLAGSISLAVERVRSKIPAGIKIEVETTSLDEVKEAVACGVDMIMLDNMSYLEMKEAVAWVKGRIPLEVSGNVDLERIKEIASLGVDFVSVGSLTHSFHSLDISMEFY